MLHTTEYEVEPGELIIQQGEVGSGFYVLKAGAVEVYKDGLLLNVLTFPGTIFGEMGDILGKPRSCSVKARNRCKLQHFSEGDAEILIREEPRIAVRIIKTLASRLERTTAKLTEQFQEPSVWSIAPESKEK